ncbi:MAG: aminopeptidase [Pseudomonadaceae bacterium]|nr:aminopeptidase [Pseudomonadaceae bacterium]
MWASKLWATESVMVAPKRPGSNRRYALLLASLLLAGCDTLHFYSQAIAGQWQLLHARTTLEQLAQTPDVDPATLQRLARAQEVLDFAQSDLGLAAQGRYSSYVSLQRDYVVWNVFAAEAFDLSGQQWCYPLVGCAPYRGYFHEADARALAADYETRGYETYVGGVPAYSTLGWFNDPLLDTFIFWPDADLAALLIHELAHGRVWIRNDVAFNESFAEFVGQTGAQQWLQEQGLGQDWQIAQQQRAMGRRFRQFLMQVKTALLELYETTPQTQLPEAKRSAVGAWKACYLAHKAVLGGGRYDALMQSHFNNALLVSVSTYADYLGSFAALYRQTGERWDAFFRAVDELAELDQSERETSLASLAEQQNAHTADDKNTQQVNCDTFLRHGANAEPTA